MNRSSTGPDPGVVRELAPDGRLRAAINFGNPVLAQADPNGAGPRGVSVDLARELAGRLGIGLDLVTFDAAGKVVAALEKAAWDVAFLAIDPVRAAQIEFTPPYVLIEGTYLVRSEAPWHRVDDLDQAGIRIAVGRGAAYDLFLTRALQHAGLVRADTSPGALDLLVEGASDAAAGVRQPLTAFAQAHPGYRVLPDRFTAIQQAMAVPKGRVRGYRYVTNFIEEMKRSGFVAAALERSGQRDAAIAPAAAESSTGREVDST